MRAYPLSSRSSLYTLLLVAGLLLVFALPAQAQEAAAVQDATAAGATEGEVAPAPAVILPSYNPRDYIPLAALTPEGEVLVTDEVIFQSLLFNATDINTIISTLNRRSRNAPARGMVVDGGQGGFVLPGEAVGEGEAEVKPYYPPIPTKRVISLSGVVYRKPNDWIVWLNGHKLVPGAKLPELVDIRVERDRVHLKWFDIGMAKIIALTLRPRQTYDITSGVLLTSSEAEGR